MLPHSDKGVDQSPSGVVKIGIGAYYMYYNFFTFTYTFIIQVITFKTITIKASNCVVAVLLAPSIVSGTFIHVYKKKSIHVYNDFYSLCMYEVHAQTMCAVSNIFKS